MTSLSIRVCYIDLSRDLCKLYLLQVTDTSNQSVGTIIKHWAGGVAVVSQDHFSVNCKY